MMQFKPSNKNWCSQAAPYLPSYLQFAIAQRVISLISKIRVRDKFASLSRVYFMTLTATDCDKKTMVLIHTEKEILILMFKRVEISLRVE